MSGLAPVVGDYAFDHRSPSHLAEPAEFEAFQPDLVGGERRLQRAPSGDQQRQNVRRLSRERHGHRTLQSSAEGWQASAATCGASP